ncbi:putative haloacid dehalogenase-like hydrolase [Colletotrichum tofieldiae]|nr:putative haloacid dehalogenase-like hydrolase [Colletotrichum tofieldiae]
MQSLEESDNFLIDHVLEAVDDMTDSKQPKVLLFDIGGVCVVSPFQAILDYELSLGIPPGWVNYSLSKTSPTGFWHRLETGSIPMDEAFFAGFNADLHDQGRWEAFYAAQRAKNPSLPEQVPPLPAIDGEYLFNTMMTNSIPPDPWMFPALNKLKESGKYILAALSNTVIFPEGHRLWRKDFLDDPVRSLFDVFISSAHVGLRKPDPRMYRLALKVLNEYAAENAGSERGRALRWAEGIKADDVVFLDDIGENLKEARNQGFGTIKVHLGRAYEAVEELEKITGLPLEGDHPKIPLEEQRQGEAIGSDIDDGSTRQGHLRPSSYVDIHGIHVHNLAIDRIPLPLLAEQGPRLPLELLRRQFDGQRGARDPVKLLVDLVQAVRRVALAGQLVHQLDPLQGVPRPLQDLRERVPVRDPGPVAGEPRAQPPRRAFQQQPDLEVILVRDVDDQPALRLQVLSPRLDDLLRVVEEDERAGAEDDVKGPPVELRQRLQFRHVVVEQAYARTGLEAPLLLSRLGQHGLGDVDADDLAPVAHSLGGDEDLQPCAAGEDEDALAGLDVGDGHEALGVAWVERVLIVVGSRGVHALR